MDVHAFIRSRPCLEGIDGYLEGLRLQLAHPELLHGLQPQYAAIDGEVLKPLEEYRQRLLAGKEVPAPTALEQDWVYKLKTRPLRKRVVPFTGEEPDIELSEEPPAPRRVLDLNARGRK
jgi:hypothetical protein